MRIRDLVSFAVFGAIIICAIGHIASFGIRFGPPVERTKLSMSVPDINGLVVGSSVLLRGVSVGQVTSIQSAVNLATVEFYIDNRHRVPMDSDVRLDNLSALGETYIGLMPRTGNGPILQDGQHIVAESIDRPASISQLATSVVRVLKQTDPDQLKRIIEEADIAFPRPESALPNLARASVLVRSTTTDLDGRGKDVLHNFETLLRNAGFVGPALAQLVPDVRALGPGFQAMYAAAMAITLADSPMNLGLFQQFLGRIQHFLDDRAPDIKVITEALLPKVHGIAGSLMTFDTGQILANMLDAVPEDGAITLHVTIPDR